MEYKVLKFQHYDLNWALDELEQQVQKHLRIGWALAGGVAITATVNRANKEFDDYTVLQAVYRK